MMDRILQRPGQILLVMGLLTLGMLFSLRNLQFDFSPQVIFESDHESFRYLQRYFEVFGRDDDELLFLLVAEEGLTIDTPDAHQFVEVLHAALEKRVSYLVRIQSLARTPPDLLRKGLLSRILISQDRRATAILVRIAADRLEYQSLQPIVNQARDTLNSLVPPAGYSLHMVGVPRARVSVVEGLIGDQVRFFPVSLTLFILLFYVVLRNSWAVFFCLGSVGMAMFWGLGFLAMTGKSIDILNNVLPTLMFVIGSSDAVHLVLRYRDELRSGRSQEEAIHQTMSHLSLACLFTSLTTAVGFASLLAARINILQYFGLYCSVGIGFSYLLVVTVLPCGLKIVPPIAMPASGSDSRSRVERGLDALADFVIDRPRSIFVFSVILVGVFGGLALQVTPRTNIHEAVPDEDPLFRDVQVVEERYGGFIPVALVLEWEPGVEILHPDSLDRIRGLRSFLEDQPEIRMAVSVADLIDDFGPLVFTPSCSEPLERVFRAEQRMTRILGWSADVGSDRIQDCKRRIEAEIERVFQGVPGVLVRVTGDGPVATEGIGFLIGDLLASFFLAFGIIFFMMILLLRSWRAALVSMIPNLAPLILTMGFMGAMGMDMRVSSVVVFSVSLGLAVDDTIHFMVRYAEEWGIHQDAAVAVRRTFQGAGKAILGTTLLLGVGFGVLLLSHFPITRTFSTLMIMTLLGAVFGDLLLLPACLLLFQPFRHHRPVGTVSGEEVERSES